MRCTKIDKIHRLGASFPVSATRFQKTCERSLSTGVAVEDKITVSHCLFKQVMIENSVEFPLEKTIVHLILKSST